MRKQIYFIRAGKDGPVKIGIVHHKHTRNVRLRMINLQAGNHTELFLLRIIPVELSEAERWLHEYFKTKHIRGEWFEFTEEMLTISVPDKFINISLIL